MREYKTEMTTDNSTEFIKKHPEVIGIYDMASLEEQANGLHRWKVVTVLATPTEKLPQGTYDDEPRYTYDSEGNEVDNDWLGY